MNKEHNILIFLLMFTSFLLVRCVYTDGKSQSRILHVQLLNCIEEAEVHLIGGSAEKLEGQVIKLKMDGLSQGTTYIAGMKYKENLADEYKRIIIKNGNDDIIKEYSINELMTFSNRPLYDTIAVYQVDCTE